MTKQLFSFIVIILSIVFSFFYVKPEYTLMQERRADFANLIETLNASAIVKTLIRETRRNLSSVAASDLARFDIFLPDVIDPIHFANDLQYLGTMNGVILENIKVTEPKNLDQKSTGVSSEGVVTQLSRGVVFLESHLKQDQGVVPNGNPVVSTTTTTTITQKEYVVTKASFTCTATYEKFSLFLDSLEKSLGLINVTALSFTPYVETDPQKIKAGGGQTYEFSASIETYSLK